METTDNLPKIDIRPGFRLHRLEVLNWGTFTSHIWTIRPCGSNSLLTGDIGSGKSTIVDAITTLLVPYNKITYNKAAGAENDERSLLSYLKGQYGNIQDANTRSAKPQYVRENYEDQDYSVLLACFFNESFQQAATIAQVFWMRNGRPEKFFVVAEAELNINAHFSNFGNDINQLKKKLRKTDNTEVFDSFTEYSGRFRQIFGIQTVQALDLFYRTASMKSVPNLTDFVRQQMLEETDIKDKIDDLKKRFEHLTESYNAVQKAKTQLSMLAPMMEDLEEFEKICNEITELRTTLELIPGYFASQKINLLKEELYRLNDEYTKLSSANLTLRDRLKELRDRKDSIRMATEKNESYQRLHKIEEEIAAKSTERDNRSKRCSEYTGLIAKLDMPGYVSEETFYSTINEARTLGENLKGENDQLTERRDDHKISLSRFNEDAQDLGIELASLRQRKSQIPEQSLKLRERILEDLELDEEDLPFAGELIKVRDSEREWEGAAERLLHNFALSLLVPEKHYKRVSSYVDKTHLKGRLVYFRMMAHDKRKSVTLLDHSLVHKLEIKSDSEHCDWMHEELEEKFNYACCESIDEFYREQYAITRQGQIKSGKVRHEKDDRRTIHDRKNYVLGWSNKEKIEAIAGELHKIEKKIKEAEAEIKSIEALQKKVAEKGMAVHDLLKFRDYSEINFGQMAAEIKALEEELQMLRSSSDELEGLHKQLDRVNKEIDDAEKEVNRNNQQSGIVINKVNTTSDDLYRSLEKLNLVLPGSELSSCFESPEQIQNELEAWIGKVYHLIGDRHLREEGIVRMVSKHLSEESITLKNIDAQEKRTADKINGTYGLINKKTEEEKKVRDGIIKKMQKYKHEYPAETTETDASIEAKEEFRQYYETLVKEDLPRHEERFRKSLKEGAINGIALFQNQLEIHQNNIVRKIADINSNLRTIDYTPNTFIKIEENRVDDTEIADFRNELKLCMENTFGEEDHYTEEKYLQVKKILDRFRSAEEADRRWTSKVTDVRQWYTFGASERYKEDEDKEKEFYSDSSGKSGGQKEKLAYTVLASALAYQFGLDWDEQKSRSFRFAVIDEAFGRGSDESTRYGLELFRKLNLQLLIVTPLQKINVIENYIDVVHFVSNPSGKNSMVRDLTKQQYEQEKAEFFHRQEGTGNVVEQPVAEGPNPIA